MASLSDQIRDHPMFFAQLNRLHRQREQFPPPKATPNQHREHRSVALAAESVGAGALQRWPLLEVRVLRTADFACSRSGRASTRLGGFFFFRDFDIEIGRASCRERV